MRTTLTLDSDVAAKTREAARKTGLPFKTVVNNALRLGIGALLEPRQGRPYRTEARPMRLRSGLNCDNISDLLERAEGESYR
jgi:hypothetical protein